VPDRLVGRPDARDLDRESGAERGRSECSGRWIWRMIYLYANCDVDDLNNGSTRL
jgi:hypothetical protein